MRENTPSQQDSNSGEYDPLLQAMRRPIQYQLAKQGIYVSPDEAHELLEQKIIHNGKLTMQRHLAEHGIEVSPDEAFAIQKLRILHRMMEHTGTNNPHEAVERIVTEGPPRPYEPYAPNE